MSRIKPQRRRMITAEIVRAQRITPSFHCLTLGGEQLDDFQGLGADQMFRLFFRRPHQDAIRLPTSSNEGGWMAQTLLMNVATRPYVRNYTVREFRPDVGELDVELVLHDGASPASAWAREAQPGERVGIFDEGRMYTPPTEVDWRLLVGDESAVPAILSILDGEEGPARPTEVFLEVPTEQDVRPLPVPANVLVHWLPRTGAADRPGRLALDTVTAARLPAGRFSAFVAGEQALPRRLRSHLLTERGARKADITIFGYWRHGRSSPG